MRSEKAEATAFACAKARSTAPAYGSGNLIATVDFTPKDPNSDLLVEGQVRSCVLSVGWGSQTCTSTAEQRVWLAANSSPFSYLMTSTTDQTWTELGRSTVGDLKAFAGQIYIQGKRTDTYDAYFAEVKFFAKRIGALTLTQIIVLESSPSPAVGHQITIDGNDVLVEVRGKVAEDWDWTALKFFREIT